MNNIERGVRVAREIFDILPNTRRIAFKAGPYKSETDLGGLCEEALADALIRIFDQLDAESAAQSSPNGACSDGK